jgi:hypothetical protein
MSKMTMAQIRELAKKKNSESNKKADYKNTDIYPFWNMNEGDEAVIRILPNKTEENHPIPLIEKKEHRLAIEGKDRKVVCPQNYGHECPICDLCQEYYKAEGKESENGKYYWRNLMNICRAVVISDPLPPDDDTGENFENKVVTLQLGFQLYEKIMAQLDDFFDDDDPLPWDLEKGFNFKIKKTKQGKYMKYDLASTFEKKPSEIPTEALENIELKELEEFLPKEITYEEADELLNKHLEGGVGGDDDSLEKKKTNSDSAEKRKKLMDRLSGESEEEEELDDDMKGIVDSVKETEEEEEESTSNESNEEEDEDEELAAIIARHRKNKS